MFHARGDAHVAVSPQERDPSFPGPVAALAPRRGHSPGLKTSAARLGVWGGLARI